MTQQNHNQLAQEVRRFVSEDGRVLLLPSTREGEIRMEIRTDAIAGIGRALNGTRFEVTLLGGQTTYDVQEQDIRNLQQAWRWGLERINA